VALVVVLLVRLDAEVEAARRVAMARGQWDVMSCWDCPPPLSLEILFLVDLPAAALSLPFGILGRWAQWAALVVATAWCWFWAGRRIDWLRARQSVAPPGRAATVFYAVATVPCLFIPVGVCWSVLHGYPWLSVRTPLLSMWPLAFAAFFGARSLAGTRAWRKPA
jgi:hypothetical protein